MGEGWASLPPDLNTSGPALPPLVRSLCMMSALPASDPSNLHDWATRRKEDAGMPSYFSPAVHAVPPLVDIPQQLVSDVLFGGLTPQGAWQHECHSG